MGGWFKEELPGLEGLKGLKMRIPGLGDDVMNALGASVQVIAGGEIYPALERGAIDATEWVGPYDDEKLGFYKVAKNYYYPGWWEPGPSMSIYIGEKAWSSLPGVYQEILKSAIHEAGLEMQRRYDARNPEALQKILTQGVTLRPFSEDLLSGALEASIQILEDFAAKDAGYKKVHDHWKAARAAQFKFFLDSRVGLRQVCLSTWVGGLILERPSSLDHFDDACVVFDGSILVGRCSVCPTLCGPFACLILAFGAPFLIGRRFLQLALLLLVCAEWSRIGFGG